MKGRLIVIGGPTATGKTALSVAVAKALNGEVLSCDSMQIYKRLDVGTAKATLEEMQGVRHHMLDIVEPTDSFSVAEYQRMATEVIDDIISRGKMPIMVGGTGLYINSVLYPMSFRQFDPTVRQHIEEMYAQYGNRYMHDLLATKDPQTAARLAPNDVKRVTRALELSFVGETHSQGDMQQAAQYDYRMYVLSGDRKALYDRIDRRVDVMLSNGLLDEIQSILAEGVPATAQCFQAIAYKEFAAYLEGSLTFDDAVALIKKRSRNYAKRQLTWFRQYADAVWLDYNDCQGNLERIIHDNR